MSNPLTSQLLEALRAVGERLDWPGDIEILLVGGLAGVVTGVLPATRITVDCDIAILEPAEAASAVRTAADEIGRTLKLGRNWLSDQVSHLNVVPDGWRSRRQHVGHFGKLQIYAVGRLDLIAMKVLAHRDLDVEDLHQMKVTREEIGFVSRYLQMLKLPSRGADLDQIAAAEKYLRALEHE